MKPLHPLTTIKIIGTAIGIGALVLVAAIKIPDRVIASASDNVHGWLWSDMPDNSNHAVPSPGTSNQYGGRGFG